MMDQKEQIDLFVKGAVAFFITLGWAVILYPLVRKLHRSWLVLLILSLVLSLYFFIAKEMMDNVTPIFDNILTYILGIFFGIAFLSFLFNFKSRWLNVQPKDDSLSGSGKVKKHLHLRHILQVAITMEDRGKNFYYRLAEKALNQDVKQLCRKLAQDEVRHKQTIEDILYKWLTLPIDKEAIAVLEEELRFRGIFLNPPSFDSSEEDMFKYAVDQEKKMADFYLSFERAFPEAWKRTYVQMLATEEKSHMNQLLDSHPNLKA